MNVAIVGRRGTGKTTWCYKIVGLDAPVRPYGTSTVNFMSCQLSGKSINVWDCPAGLGRHFENMLHTMSVLVVCYNGRCIQGSIKALTLKYNKPIIIAVTRLCPWSFLHLSDLQNVTGCNVIPVCTSQSELQQAILRTGT